MPESPMKQRQIHHAKSLPLIQKLLWPISLAILAVTNLGKLFVKKAKSLNMRTIPVTALLCSSIILVSVCAARGDATAMPYAKSPRIDMTETKSDIISSAPMLVMSLMDKHVEKAIQDTFNEAQMSIMRIEATPQSQISDVGPLFEIAEPDPNYLHPVVALTSDDRYITEHLVMGEAGNQGYEGAVLVAQALRDALVYEGYDSVATIRKALKYAGSLETEPNQDVLDAVSYIFDQGGIGIQHKILYFYSGYPEKIQKWHESQHFIFEYKAHRFFDKW